jgi:S1-C subfamily serine protease
MNSENKLRPSRGAGVLSAIPSRWGARGSGVPPALCPALGGIGASSLLASLLCFMGLIVSLAAPAGADELADKGRAIFKSHQQAVVTVQVVLKSKFSMGGLGGQANESRQDLTGTVLDPSGLTVLALSATDPGQMMQSMIAGMTDEDSKIKMETELSDVKILLDDGVEVPAEVVLRDKDLDLAFIRPKAKPANPMAALDLTQAGRAEILDQVISLNRLGSAAGRAYAASVERISAIVQRPRLFYVPESSQTSTALGAPAFTLEGKPLGIFVMRATKSRGGALGLFSLRPDNMTGIIVPAEDVLKAAKQAPAAAEPAAAAVEDKEKK